jgi:hypothetical protein
VCMSRGLACVCFFFVTVSGRYTTFTFVREPLARYVSGYFSAMKWVKMKRHKQCAAALVEAHASAKRPPVCLKRARLATPLRLSSTSSAHPLPPPLSLSFRTSPPRPFCALLYASASNTP